MFGIISLFTPMSKPGDIKQLLNKNIPIKINEEENCLCGSYTAIFNGL